MMTVVQAAGELIVRLAIRVAMKTVVGSGMGQVRGKTAMFRATAGADWSAVTMPRFLEA